MLKLKELNTTEMTLADLSKFEITGPKFTGKLKVTELTPEMYSNSPYILQKYFRNENKDLDRCHIPPLTKDAYKQFISLSRGVSKENSEFETASDYYKMKARKAIMARDFGVQPNQIDTTDYFWDERYYTCSDFWTNQDRVENAYRETGNDQRLASANDVYIKQDPRTAQMENELYNSLFMLVIKAIRTRKVMLLQRIEPLCGVLNNICEYTYGFAENPTRSMMLTLKNYVEFFQRYLNNKEVQEFLKENNDVTVYASDENYRTDYIETYVNVLKSIYKCTELELQELHDIIACPDDPYADEILNACVLTTTQYGYERGGVDDEDSEPYDKETEYSEE